MEDLTGLGKIADSKLAQNVYHDAAAKGANQVGELLEDTLKTFRLFTAPIQLLAAYQDRLRVFLDQVRDGVPRERQVEAPASIAGPVMMNIQFEPDESLIRSLYLKLLQRAIDRAEQSRALPSFIKIIEQLSPEEAVILQHLRVSHYLTMSVYTDKPRMPHLMYQEVVIKTQEGPQMPKEFDLFGGNRVSGVLIYHLESLSLVVNLEPKVYEPPKDQDWGGDIHFTSILAPSPLGEEFMRVCVPDLYPDSK